MKLSLLSLYVALASVGAIGGLHWEESVASETLASPDAAPPSVKKIGTDRALENRMIGENERAPALPEAAKEGGRDEAERHRELFILFLQILRTSR